MFLIAVILITAAQLFGQGSETPDMVEWNEYYKLSWEDFHGKPDARSAGDAATAVHIKAKPYYVKNQVFYNVEAYFDRTKSWARDRSVQLLEHEQLHFDIAELYARKIRKKISDMRERGENDVQVYNAAIREILEESNEADVRYDMETLHGAMTKKQAAWEQRVKEELAGLKDYKKKKRVITVDKRLKKRPHIFG